MADDKLHILLVDDNPDDLEIITRQLEHEFPGVEVAHAGAREQFDRALEAGRFNLVITDFQLQWGDGLVALRAVKGRFPYCPVIMFTATGTQEVTVEAMKSGLDDYIVKSPDHYARLMSSVRESMHHREAERRAVELQMRLDHLLGWINLGVFRAESGGRLLECNAAFLRLLGVDSLEAARDIFERKFAAGMATDRSPLDKRVMSPAREVRVPLPGGERWFLVEEVIVAAADGRRVVDGVAEDITERKRMEEKTRFFDSLNQAVRTLVDPEEIMSAAARMLGEYLDVDSCAYAEIEPDEKYLCVKSEHTRGETSGVASRFTMDDLGPEALRIMRADRPFVVNDVEAEARAGRELSLFRQAGMRAMICVLLKKNGNYVAMAIVSQKTPRRWEPWEVELVSKVANRCWESIQLTITVRTLRESDERYRAFITNSSEAIWRIELEQPIPVNLPEDEQVDMVFKYAYLAECNDAMARMYGYETADQIAGARISDLLLRSDLRNIDQIRAFRRAGYNITNSESYEVDRYGNTKYFLNNLIGIVENGAVVRAWGMQRDITELKRAEETARESEERLRRISAATQDSIWEIDLKTNLLWWSEQARPLFWNRPGNWRPSMEDWCDGIHPEDVERVKARFEQFLRNDERAWTDEYRFRRADGSYVYILDQGQKFYDEGGTPILIAGAMTDITERKRAEEALSESEERFAKAFRASPDGLVISRLADGIILEVNDSFAALSGYERDEMIGKSTLDLGLYVDSADRQRALAILKEKNYVRDFEFELRRKSGEARLITFSAEPLELRGEHCWLTIVHDITERRRAEEALRKSEEHARRQLSYVEAIYATAPVGLCFLDSDLRFLRINDLLAEFDGKSVEEHLGRTVREAAPEVADKAEPVLRRVIETGEPALNVEESVVTAAQPGVVRHFISSYYPIKNGDGRALGVNVVVMDITQIKKIEEELARLLRQEKAAHEEAQAANRMKDEFLATVSHELRTPLTSILGWARILTGRRLTEAQARHALEVIAQSAQSQSQLIEDILDTSRIIAGSFKLDTQSVVIEHIFHAAVDVIRPSAEAKGVFLSAVVDEPDGVVLGDANRLQQAIWNLLSNAVKFTGECGRIEARLGRAEGQIEIAVKDTGIGIESGFLPHVFDRFRQADSTSTREHGGLGIGLAIVRHIVEMHGGGVSASSPGTGQGATFRIRLPMISALRPEGLETEPAPAPEIERKVLNESHRLDEVRVLLVEDNPETLDMLKVIFEESGAEVIAGTSVDEALDALDRFRPDVLVSDISMLDRDGYDLVREVRARAPERSGKIPAVALTAYVRAEDRVRVLSAGFQMHVAKPIDPDDLITAVASLTGRIYYQMDDENDSYKNRST
jgi:PAS domain S-box-containing protein